MFVLFNGASCNLKTTSKMNGMKIKMIVCSALAAFLLTGCISIEFGDHEHDDKNCEKGEKCEKCGKDEHHDREVKQAKLMAEAKVSREAARQTALAKVPDGTVKEFELEKEHGKLQWSFDMATPDSKDITEVNVDAMTGKVISVEKGSAEEKADDNDKDKD
jgi:uncharacterized membrane protein YkoI